MQLTIKSRKLRQKFEFFKSSGDSYIFLESNNRPGILGQQICRGGHFTGSTIAASDAGFESACRRWYRAHVSQYADIYEID